MELPSMVQRSGNTLIVRSVVSGNLLYMDHSNGFGRQQNTWSYYNNNNTNIDFTSANDMEQQLKQAHIVAPFHQQQLQSPPCQNFLQQNNINSELKDEDLPQCKIKRNYRCRYCNYSTTNPRYHLTHLRDMHGEKIVINKCRLCLYASRHFQKLVRHMKMVHGCTEATPGQRGQLQKRGLVNRGKQRPLQQLQGNPTFCAPMQHAEQGPVEKSKTLGAGGI